MPRKRKSTGGAAPSPQAKKAKKRSAAQSKLPLQNFQQLSLLAPLILNQCHLQLPQSIVQNQHLFQQASQPPLQDTQSVLLCLQQPREGIKFDSIAKWTDSMHIFAFIYII